MKRHRVLGLVAGAFLVSGVLVNAGQEPALGSSLARRAAALSARANAGAAAPLARRAAVLAARANPAGASTLVLGAAAVQVVGVVWKSDDTPVERLCPEFRGKVLA